MESILVSSTLIFAVPLAVRTACVSWLDRTHKVTMDSHDSAAMLPFITDQLDELSSAVVLLGPKPCWWSILYNLFL